MTITLTDREISLVQLCLEYAKETTPNSSVYQEPIAALLNRIEAAVNA